MGILKQLKENIIADSISRVKGKDSTFIFRRGFFYRHGNTANMFSCEIIHQLEKLGYKATLMNQGEVWKPFRAGASVKASSHWYTEILICAEILIEG